MTQTVKCNTCTGCECGLKYLVLGDRGSKVDPLLPLHAHNTDRGTGSSVLDTMNRLTLASNSHALKHT